MMVPVDNVGDVGIVADWRDRELPPNAWTAGRNVGFLDHKVQRGRGSKRIYDPPSVAPYWLHYTIDSGRAPALVYAGLEAVYAVLGGAHYDITRSGGAYTGGESDRWNGGDFAGISILNNGVDVPQRWAPISAATLLEDLDNWPADWRAKVVRPFKNFLIAMDLTDTGTRYPQRIVFSHPADPGAVPSSWDLTDPTKDVRSRDLIDAKGGAIIDGVPLGDVFVVYKESSTHGATFIGGVQKWKTAPIFESGGALALKCAVAFDDNSKHFVATGEDVIVHAGQQGSRQSVISKKQKRWLQANISTSQYQRSFCIDDQKNNSCWFCFPLEGSDWPNLAMVFNWEDGQISFRDLPQVSSIVPALVTETTGPAWSGLMGTWADQTQLWDTFTTKPFLRQLVGAVPSLTQLRQLDSTNQDDGANFAAYVERSGLDVMGIDRYGHLMRSQQQRKLVKGVWPRASGAPFQVQIGSQDQLDGTITWSTAKTFTPGVDEKVDFAVEAKLWGIRFLSTGDGYWELDGYDVDVEPLGSY